MIGDIACVKPKATCDGMNAKCRAIFEDDNTMCSNQGICKGGQCVNDLKTCQASVSSIVSNCQMSCQSMSKSYGAVCTCDENGMASSDCWTKQRAFTFTAGEGEDLAKYTGKSAKKSQVDSVGKSVGKLINRSFDTNR